MGNKRGVGWYRTVAKFAGWVLVGCLGACAASDMGTPSAIGGKGDSAPSHGSEGAKAPTGRGPQVLAEHTGHWNAATQTLTFTPVTAPAAGPSVKPQGFVEVRANLLTYGTPSSIKGPVPSFNGGQGCDANKICAFVQITNTDAGRKIDNVFAEITQISTGAVGANSDVVPTGYPVSNALGLWSFGSLDSSGGGNTVRWDFALSTSNDFSFTIKTWGTFLRTSYAASSGSTTSTENTFGTGSVWRDACLISGHTTTLVSQAPGAVANGILLPFPFTLYDVTFDTDSGNSMSISSSGAIGFSDVTTGTNVTLPDSSGAFDYTIFPFWDSVQTTASGVCYALEGTTPTRTFVVTWKNADISTTGQTENLTFSAILREGDDRVQFVFNRWSNLTTNCAATGTIASRGYGATIGIQGADFGSGAVGTLWEFNGANGASSVQLPVHNSTCPGNGFQVTFTAATVNP